MNVTGPRKSVFRNRFSSTQASLVRLPATPEGIGWVRMTVATVNWQQLCSSIAY